MPVPVAIIMCTALGSLGSSSTLPVGPVIVISSPGFASHLPDRQCTERLAPRGSC